MTLGDVWHGRQAWQALVQLKLPVRLAYRVGKYAGKVAREFASIETQRTALVRQYGEPAAGGTHQVTPDQMPAFEADIAELFAMEAELEPYPATMDELIEQVAEDDSNTLEPRLIPQLEPFFQASE